MDNIKNGVWATMITPFTKHNKVDYKGIERLLEFYNEKGVSGVFALCQSSEMFNLNLKEKKDIIRFITRNSPSEMQVIVSGNTGDTLEEQLRDADEIMCEGVKTYVILPNRFASANEEDDILIERMEQFLNSFANIPMGIYECPYPYKRTLSSKVLKWCISTGRFQFIKDTCCDLIQIREKLSLLSGTSIKLFNANSATLLESLKLGAQGYSGVMANFHPEFYVWLCNNFRKEPDKAEIVQQFIGCCSMVEYQYYPVNAKYNLALRGVPIENECRVLNKDNFKECEKMEIKQMCQLSLWAQKVLSI